jgi:two-component system, chemotaxis family, chemotaxis protein CheY
LHVLVLDDSDIMRDILVKQLLAVGVEKSQISEARNGAEALRKLNSDTFSFLLLDIVMDGIDGISVLKEAKKIQPEAKIVMCSTFSQSETVKELINMGIDDFIVKPFSEARIKETLLRVLSTV